MKKVLVALSLMLSISTIALASPFLVSDPQPASSVTSYTVNVDGTDNTVTPTVNAADTTTVFCKYDLVNIISGSHKVTVTAVNMWGQSTAVPFTFAKTLPTDPTNIKLVP